MKFFLIVAENFDYDEYDSVVVAAESKEEALDMLKYDEDSSRIYIGDEKCAPYFYRHQGKIKIEEITEKGVVLSSFNAG